MNLHKFKVRLAGTMNIPFSPRQLKLKKNLLLVSMLHPKSARGTWRLNSYNISCNVNSLCAESTGCQSKYKKKFEESKISPVKLLWSSSIAISTNMSGPRLTHIPNESKFLGGSELYLLIFTTRCGIFNFSYLASARKVKTSEMRNHVPFLENQ